VVHAINFLMIFIIGRVCAAWGIDDSTAVIETFSPTQVARKTLTSREAIRAIGLAMIVIGGLWLYRREHLAFEHSLDRLRPYRTLVASLRDDPDFLLREFYAQPQHQIPPRREESVTGDLPQLVVFTDFECPACYCNWRMVQEQIVEAFGSRLDVSVRHYPLCNACNEAVETEGHRNACAAACAAEAARVLGGDGAFWRMHNLLFENRKRLGAALYRDLAVRIGLDADRFIAEMDGEPIRDIVTRDIALGRTVGVTQTPTMFLNGRRITELCQGPTFWKTIARQWSSAPGVGEEGFKDSRIEGFKDEG
jgi:protein-disulfide isomerase